MYFRFKEYEDRRHRSIVITAIVSVLLTAAIAAVTFFVFGGDFSGLGIGSENPDEGPGTDSGDIGINVTTGKVQMDIVDYNEKSLIGDALDFITEDDSKVIFEPGVTFVTEGFKVKNIGDFPVKYRAYISDNETFPRAEFDKAFEIWITEDPDDPDSAARLTEFEGELEAGESSRTYFLVIRMSTDAGNEYQDKNYTGIGITVNATQKETEE